MISAADPGTRNTVRSTSFNGDATADNGQATGAE